MKAHRKFPITKKGIRALRKVIQKNYSKAFEKGLTDKEVLHISETVLMNARLNDLFKENHYLAEDDIIEY